MIPTLHIRLFGEFLLLSDDRPVNTVNLPRLQSLLTYLVLHHGTPQSRARLAYLFWPDTTDAQALSNLRTLVHRLRMALPNADCFLHIDRQNLQWKPQSADSPWTLDVQEFENALHASEQAEEGGNVTEIRQTLEYAISLYQGELLPGCYEEWILPERERLHQIYLRTLESLIALLQQEHEYEQAIDMAQLLLRHDPLHESTYRQLMNLHIARGDRVTALRVYHTCTSILERELGAKPGLATREVYDRLMHMEEKKSSTDISIENRLMDTPLIGRRREWVKLQETWRQASKNGTSLVLLTGEAGTGKTRLAEELVAWTSRQGAAIASTRCYAAEGELAYAPITAWLRSDFIRETLPRLSGIWLTELARFVPDILVERPDLAQPGPLLESWQKQRLFEAIARAISGTHQPILLLIDDMQWCDQETLECLHYLFRFDVHSPLLLIGTLRSEEIDAGHPLRTLLTALRRKEQITEIELDALDASETTALAAQMSGHQLNAHVAATIYKETEGNPLFIVEAVRAGLIDQYSTSSPPSQSSPTLPTTVQAVVDARLEQLTPLAQKVVQLASVIGRSFTFAVLAHISKEDEDTLIHALDELWRRRIIREQVTSASDAYDFSHDKLREVSYASLSNTHRRHLHRKVAEALEQVYANALDRVNGQIAFHFERADLPEQACAYYQLAGEAAMQVYAHTEAITMFQRAIKLLGSISQNETSSIRRDITARLYERVGDIHALSGQSEHARKAYEQALYAAPTSESILRAGLYCKIGNAWEAQRNNESALYHYAQAESMLGKEPSEVNLQWWQQWIEIQRNRLQVYYWLDHVPEMMELIEKLQPIVEEYGNADQQATFFQSICLMTIRRLHYAATEEALGYAQAALAAAEKSGNVIVTNWAYFNLGGAYLLRSNFDKAEHYLQLATNQGEQIGDVMLQAKGLAFLTLVYRRRGQLEKTERSNTQAESLAKRVQDAEFLGMTRATSAWLAWRNGDFAKAQVDGEAALACWRQTEVIHAFQWTALWPLISIALSEKNLPKAVNYAQALLGDDQQCLHETVTEQLKVAIGAWEIDQQDATTSTLHETIILAQSFGYL